MPFSYWIQSGHEVKLNCMQTNWGVRRIETNNSLISFCTPVRRVTFMGCGPSVGLKFHNLMTKSRISTGYLSNDSLHVFLMLPRAYWQVVQIEPLVSKQVEASGILNHWPNTQQILADRLVLNLKIWKNARCHFSYWYPTVGHGLRRNCLAPWSVTQSEYGLCVTNGKMLNP